MRGYPWVKRVWMRQEGEVGTRPTMSQNQVQTNAVVTTELWLERLREYVAAGLAFVVILGMLVMGYIAVVNLGSAESFQRAKDLLLIVNPFVGVVIGYYFNKVTSDARAVALQRAADTASEVALTASADSQRAEQQAQAAQQQTEQLRGALGEMVAAAESAGAGKPGTLGLLSGDDEAAREKQIEFRLALERARRALAS